jgi:hypothetical protein
MINEAFKEVLFPSRMEDELIFVIKNWPYFVVHHPIVVVWNGPSLVAWRGPI